MKIPRRTETWIHAHFVTDGSLLTVAYSQQSKNKIQSLLRLEESVLGIHFEGARDNQGLCIVLECIPPPETMERIQAHVEKTIQDIPGRRPTSRRVYFE